MITFISAKNPDEGALALAGVISEHLNAGRKALWLIAGGSNVPIAASIMAHIRKSVPVEQMHLLTVSQTDERFGPLGHKDSNWQQMIEAGFDFNGITSVPIITGQSLNETVSRWSKQIEAAFDSNEIIIGQFGMGADGHIAGLLPHSPAITAEGPVGSHTDEKFTRISLTPRMLECISTAYAFVFGDAKREAVMNLRDKKLSIDEEPAQILKSISDCSFYTDCL